MKKCKICGEIFQYHIPNSHLEEHNITRKEYKDLKINDNMFYIPKKQYSKAEDDIQNHVINRIYKSKKKRRVASKYDYL